MPWRVCIFLLTSAVTLNAAEATFCVSKTVSFPRPRLTVTANGNTAIDLPGCPNDAAPGEPLLPAASVQIEIPSGTVAVAATAEPLAPYVAALAAPPACGQPAVRPGDPAPPAVEMRQEIETSDRPWPPTPIATFRTDRAGERNLATVLLHPVRYLPPQRCITGSETWKITLTLRSRPPHAVKLDAAASPLETETFDYLLVGPGAILEAESAAVPLQTLIAARERQGHRAKTVTTEWISGNYNGTDLPAKIRNFLKDARDRWQPRYLLLVGNHDWIPTPKFPLSFTVMTTTSSAQIPSDQIYYGCLDGSMDGNGNGVYGELNDGPGGGDIDLLSELFVGRFPVADADGFALMVSKTLAYESANAEALRGAAFIGEKIDAGSFTYSDGFMELLRLGGSEQSYTTSGFIGGRYRDIFDTITLYDGTNGLFTAEDTKALLNQSPASVNNFGHGSLYSAMKIPVQSNGANNPFQTLTNALPFLVYSIACNSGAFDNPHCYAEQLVSATNAAFAAVMNTRNGWFFSNSLGGPSPYTQRVFWEKIFDGEAATIGEANECSRRKILGNCNVFNYWRWVYLELTLFGDPATPLFPAINLTPAVISHTPLPNQFDDVAEYPVVCALGPCGLYNPDTVWLEWDAGYGVHSLAMTNHPGSTFFEAAIPAQLAHTEIRYRITAATVSGLAAAFPSEGECVFWSGERMTLTVTGSPYGFGSPVPDYGYHEAPSGTVFSVRSAGVVYTADDTRHTYTNHFGTGSAPSGSEAEFTLRLDTDSSVQWQSDTEYRLTVSTPDALFDDWAQWSEAGGIFTPVEIPDPVTTNSVCYRFYEWRLDGQRFPAAPGGCDPDPGPLPADSPHRLVAEYMPEELDADGNGIPDWYELRYFGSTGNDPEADFDGDGFSLATEYGFRCDPTDAAAIPGPPTITVSPLDAECGVPPPLTLTARITDPHAVVSPTLHWRNKDEDEWRETPMTASAVLRRTFTAVFGEGFGPGATLRYYITAQNPSGLRAVSDEHETRLVYPLLNADEFSCRATLSAADTPPIPLQRVISNDGNVALTGTVALVRFDPITADRHAEWDWNSYEPKQTWQISTNRFVSAPYALHCQLNSARYFLYGAGIHGSITRHAEKLGPGTVLSFDYWIQGEPDSEDPSRTFDGGIVEYSLDGGETFKQLRGPYTHTIYGWWYSSTRMASPWEDGTPCFSGDGTEGWRTATFDLSELYPEENGFAGKSVVFRFVMGGDNNSDPEGWYIDNFRLAPMPDNGLVRQNSGGNGIGLDPGETQTFGFTGYPANLSAPAETVTLEFMTNDPGKPCLRRDWTFFSADTEDSVSLAILGFRSDGDNGCLIFEAQPGVLYHLESAESPDAEWRELESGKFPAGLQTLVIPHMAPNGFYRLRRD